MSDKRRGAFRSISVYGLMDHKMLFAQEWRVNSAAVRSEPASCVSLAIDDERQASDKHRSVDGVSTALTTQGQRDDDPASNSGFSDH